MKVTPPQTLARLLSERLAAAGDPMRAVTLQRLLEDHLAYSRVRPELQMTGKGEYDVAILRLLADRTLLQVDPAVAAAARRELESPEPELAFADVLAERLVRLRSPDDRLPAEAGTEGGDEDEGEDVPVPSDTPAFELVSGDEPPEGPPAAEDGEPGPGPESPERAPEPDLAPQPESVPEPAPTGDCWACMETLPTRDVVRFCPHCGVDQEAPRCTACGDRLEPGWAFCPRCGRALEE
ncbi:MAG: zinc-ribbon domain-containing protein [Gemmatimonadota bacterium]